MFGWFKRKEKCIWCGKEMPENTEAPCESCEIRHKKQAEEAKQYQIKQAERFEREERRTAAIWAEEFVKAWRNQ